METLGEQGAPACSLQPPVPAAAPAEPRTAAFASKKPRLCLALCAGACHARVRAARSPPPPPPAPPAALCLSPEGRGARESHVKLPNELLAAFPPHAGDDARCLADIAAPRALDVQ